MYEILVLQVVRPCHNFRWYYHSITKSLPYICMYIIAELNHFFYSGNAAPLVVSRYYIKVTALSPKKVGPKKPAAELLCPAQEPKTFDVQSKCDSN